MLIETYDGRHIVIATFEFIFLSPTILITEEKKREVEGILVKIYLTH